MSQVDIINLIHTHLLEKESTLGECIKVVLYPDAFLGRYGTSSSHPHVAVFTHSGHIVFEQDRKDKHLIVCDYGIARNLFGGPSYQSFCFPDFFKWIDEKVDRLIAYRE